MKSIQNVVFISHSKKELIKMNRFTDEFITNYLEYALTIKSALEEEFQHVHSYYTPDDFIRDIENHANSIVLSEWKFSGDRNSKTVIPAICEKYNIGYVGADPYSHILCQDKHLSKLYANEFGLIGPKHLRIDMHNLPMDRILVQELSLPVVVKPIYEAESIGITADSIKFDHDSAIEFAYNLFNSINDSVLIEEYVEGKEINVGLLKTQNNDVLIGEVLVFDNQTDSPSLYDYEKKRNVDKNGQNMKLVNYLSDDTRSAIMKLFKALSKPEYLRVDGRISGSEFVLLELTQSPGLSPDGAFHSAVKQFGYCYSKLLRELICTAKKTHSEKLKSHTDMKLK